MSINFVTTRGQQSLQLVDINRLNNCLKVNRTYMCNYYFMWKVHSNSTIYSITNYFEVCYIIHRISN